MQLAPALARFAPSPAQKALWRSQIRDIFHVPEFPWSSFYHAGAVLCLLGAVEIAYVQPIREKQERSVRLQEFVTRTRLEGFPTKV